MDRIRVRDCLISLEIEVVYCLTINISYPDQFSHTHTHKKKVLSIKLWNLALQYDSSKTTTNSG